MLINENCTDKTSQITTGLLRLEDAEEITTLRQTQCRQLYLSANLSALSPQYPQNHQTTSVLRHPLAQAAKQSRKEAVYRDAT